MNVSTVKPDHTLLVRILTIYFYAYYLFDIYIIHKNINIDMQKPYSLYGNAKGNILSKGGINIAKNKQNTHGSSSLSWNLEF